MEEYKDEEVLESPQNVIKEGSRQVAKNGSSLDRKMPDSTEKSNGTTDVLLDQGSSSSPEGSDVIGVVPQKSVILSSELHSDPVADLSQSSPLPSEVSNGSATEFVEVTQLAENCSSKLSSQNGQNLPDLSENLNLMSTIPETNATLSTPSPRLSEDSGKSGTKVEIATTESSEINSSCLDQGTPISSSQVEEGPSVKLNDDKAIGDSTAVDDKRTDVPVNKHSHPQVETMSKNKASTKLNNTSGQAKPPVIHRAVVDTTAPFESVKEAVSKFGGIVDWKAHKEQTMERRKQVQLELENVREEIPNYKKQSEAVEEAKEQVLKELDATKRFIEELKLNLERAQTDESQAKQDSELAQLRIKEIEQGIDVEASIAAKTQLEVAKARHEKAVAELKSVKMELEELQEKYQTLLEEKDTAVKSAEEAIATTKEIEKTVEDLTLELIASQESLESAHAAHLEAEEHRIGASLARDQDCLNWERELDQAKKEVQRYNEQVLMSKDLKSKLDEKSKLLLKLNSELAAYMTSRLNQETQSTEEEDKPKKLRQELEETKIAIEKTKNEVNIFRAAAESLKSEIEKEKQELASLRQREGMASVAVSSLEAEIEQTKKEIKNAVANEKEIRVKMVEIPKLLQQAAQDADQAKADAQSARDELRKAKEEAEQAKATASTAEIRLNAAYKEIEAAKASEKLAIQAVKALQESEGEDFTNGVTIPLVEYYSLSKKAHEAEVLANEIVNSAIAQIEVAKESESKILKKLEETCNEMNKKKEALRIAKEKSEEAIEGKLGAEQDLRKWRGELGQRRRASDAAKNAPVRYQSENTVTSPAPIEKVYTENNKSSNNIAESKRRRKKSFFPRILMLLARKKAESQ